jgi:hypothetical protein
MFRDYMIIMSQHHEDVVQKDFSKIIESKIRKKTNLTLKTVKLN